MLIIGLTAFALLPAVLYVHFTTPLYTATSRLLIHRSAAESAGHAATQNVDDALTPDQLAVQRDVLTSTPVLAAALAEPGVQDCEPVRGQHDLLQALKRSLVVVPTDGSLISVSIASAAPDDASCIVSAVVQSYSEFLVSTRRSGNNEALSSLRQSKAVTQAELNEKTADLLRFGEDHHVGVGEDNSGADAAELESLAEEVNEAHVAAIGARAADDELNRALAANPAREQALKWFEESSPASGSADTDDEELIRRELLSLKARQAELEQKLMPGHPSLVRIAQRIEDLNLEHDAAIQRRAVAAAQREADVQKSYDDEQRRLLDQAAQKAEYARRSAEITELQKTLDLINHRIASLSVSTSSDLPSVTVLEPATASAEPTSPDRRRILLTAVGSGFVLSCLLALLLERGKNIGTALRTDAMGIHLPILAQMPELPTNFGPLGRDQRLLSDGDPIFDEIFEGLGTILDGAKMRGRGVIALITSPLRNDGKTTLASNLAVSLAIRGRRVLLVDANLRTPAQAAIFGVANATGLSTLLEAEVSHPITAIHHTGLPSLDLVPAGPECRNPADLLNNVRFTDLLGDLAERYDYVLLDSPATVTYTDARTISASADLTLLVLRADQLNRRMFEIAHEGLTNVGANVCGVVLNSGGATDQGGDPAFGERKSLRGTAPVQPPQKRSLSNRVAAAARAIDLVRGPENKQQSHRREWSVNQKNEPSHPADKILKGSSPSDSLQA